jgi:hypothetical protein
MCANKNASEPMDKKKTLQDIFDEEDEFGLLDIKPKVSAVRNDDERLIASFAELNEFYEKHQREPRPNSVSERSLYARLKGIRENPSKIEQLRAYDRFGLLPTVATKPVASLDDIFAEDEFGLLDEDTQGLFELKHVRPLERERAEAEFVARRKSCKGFDKYEPRFKEVQRDLASGKRKLVDFKQNNLREGAYYVHNGILFLLEKINISQKEHYKPDGTRVREDGRTRCIFENGTESNMLKRSVEKILYANGQVVTENAEEVADTTFNNLTEEDQETGFIYVLASKSTQSVIRQIPHLYKIGYSRTKVEERIKNAKDEPTYLMADVQVVTYFKCYNLNPQKLEQLLHNFFGKACLEIDIFDKKGRRHTPREWFMAPLEIIEQVIRLILSNEIVKFRYDSFSQQIINL